MASEVSEDESAATCHPSPPAPAKNWVQDLTNPGLVAVVLVEVNWDLWSRGLPRAQLAADNCGHGTALFQGNAKDSSAGRGFPGRMWNLWRNLGLHPESTKQSPASS